METIVIMTNCSTPYCKSFIMFETKGGSKQIGEIDRRDGKYVIYFDADAKSLRMIGSRSNKDSAIKVLQDAIKAGFTGEVKFKWNIVDYKYKFA